MFLRSLLKVALPTFAIIGAIAFYNRGSVSSFLVIKSFTPPGGYRDQHQSPHTPSWKTWFHPSQSVSGSSSDKSQEEWNILQHLGGNGPWIEKMDGRENASCLAPPDGCSVDQVHMMSRHAERYPTTSAGNRHIEFLERAKSLGLPLNGSLAFLNHWSYFTDNPSRDFGQLTSTGPYAGTLNAFTTGVRFRTRYHDLLPSDTKVRLWASDSQRVIDTARHFASGLFGLDWESSGRAELDIIPETFERGADTLTPGDTCHKYLEDITHGHDYGAKMLAYFQDTYIPVIAQRFLEQNPALGELSNMEVYGMQEMCGFEIMVRGSSPWCDLFTKEDWKNFEYARDVIHYYRAGPGNVYAGTMGWLWLNATTTLLRAGPEAGPLFLSFVHDGDIAPFLTALGILSDPSGTNLPTSHVPTDRLWKTSSILPMGARITLERLNCTSQADQTYIRININDRIVPLPSCRSGPGGSCALPEFVDYVHRRGVEVGDFGEVCGLERHAERITFLHQN